MVPFCKYKVMYGCNHVIVGIYSWKVYHFSSFSWSGGGNGAWVRENWCFQKTARAFVWRARDPATVTKIFSWGKQIVAVVAVTKQVGTWQLSSKIQWLRLCAFKEQRARWLWLRNFKEQSARWREGQGIKRWSRVLVESVLSSDSHEYKSISQECQSSTLSESSSW